MSLNWGCTCDSSKSRARTARDSSCAAMCASQTCSRWCNGVKFSEQPAETACQPW